MKSFFGFSAKNPVDELRRDKRLNRFMKFAPFTREKLDQGILYLSGKGPAPNFIRGTPYPVTLSKDGKSLLFLGKYRIISEEESSDFLRTEVYGSAPLSVFGLYDHCLYIKNCLVRRRKIESFLRQQAEISKSQPLRNAHQTRSNLSSKVKRPGQWLQADLMEIPKPNSKLYVFGVIDVLSNFLWTRLIKNKKPETCKKAFQEILAEIRALKLVPKYLQVDDGGEFKSVMKTFVESQNIVLNASSSYNCHSIESIWKHVRKFVEVRHRVFLTKDGKNSSNWAYWLPICTKALNEQKSRKLHKGRFSPTDIVKREIVSISEVKANKKADFQKRLEKSTHTETLLKVGDLVRVCKMIGDVSKGVRKLTYKWSYGKQYSSRIYPILGVKFKDSDQATRYLLKIGGVRKYFYRNELLPCESEDVISKNLKISDIGSQILGPKAPPQPPKSPKKKPKKPKIPKKKYNLRSNA